jgi:hypothetical protein
LAYAAIIGALVNTGFDIYNQMSKPNPQKIADEYSTWIKGNAQRYIQPFTSSSYWNLDVPSMAQQSINFGLQEAPQINQQNMYQLQSLMNQAMPGWSNMFNTMQSNTNQLLAGQVPTDVQQQIQRSAAYTGMMGGMSGAGTGTTGAITARDLGLTSLQMQQQGETQGMNLMTFARNYLMPQPVNPTSLLPLSDLMSGAEYGKNATFQANEAMYTAMGNVAAAKFGAPQTSLLGGMGGDISGLISALGKSPSGQSGGSGSILSSIMGMFGGGSGGMSGLGSGAFSGGGGQTVGQFGDAGGGGASDFSSLFGGAMSML